VAPPDLLRTASTARAKVAHSGRRTARASWPARVIRYTRRRVRLVQRVDAEGDSKTIPVLTLQATVEPIVEEGLATVEEIEAALAGLAAYVADPETIIAQPRVFQLWRRRD
jgi:hypothetical protein